MAGDKRPGILDLGAPFQQRFKKVSQLPDNPHPCGQGQSMGNRELGKEKKFEKQCAGNGPADYSRAPLYRFPRADLGREFFPSPGSAYIKGCRITAINYDQGEEDP